jgi:hypothetical protein
MGAILIRLAVLALGMGLIEIGLSDAVAQGSLAGGGLALLVGVPLVLAGTAGFVGPLIGAARNKGDADRG